MQRMWIIVSAGIMVLLGGLIISATQAGTQYYYSVDELYTEVSPGDNRMLRVNGAVLGDSIEYNAQTQTLQFSIAHIPLDNQEIEAAGGIEAVLHQAVSDPTRQQLTIYYQGSAPDMLRNEAQAVVTGRLDSEGNFQATELLLQCPSKYEEQGS